MVKPIQTLENCFIKRSSLVDQIGKWKGGRKIYLTYSNKDGWDIKSFNIFKVILKKIGFYQSATLSRVSDELKKSLKEQLYISEKEYFVAEKIKAAWSKTKSSPIPLQNLPLRFSEAAPTKVCSLFKTHEGLVFGESHKDRSPMKFMVTNMAKFKAEGINKIFIESLTVEECEASCKAYFSDPKSPIPEDLYGKILFHDLLHYQISKLFPDSPDDCANYIELYSSKALLPAEMKKVTAMINAEENHPYNLKQLFIVAKQHGIEIVPMDSQEAKVYASLTERAQKGNDAFVAQVRKHVDQDPSKYIVLCGQGHAIEYEQVTGIHDKLHIPRIFFNSVSKEEEESLVDRIVIDPTQENEYTLYLHEE